jgi:hypothetical protein
MNLECRVDGHPGFAFDRRRRLILASIQSRARPEQSFAPHNRVRRGRQGMCGVLIAIHGSPNPSISAIDRNQ